MAGNRVGGLADAFLDAPDVSPSFRKGRMLLRVRERVFAVCVGTCLVVSLSPELAAALVRAGVALRLDPGPDSLLRGWVVLTPGASGTHLLLAREACEHARCRNGRSLPSMISSASPESTRKSS